MMSIAYKEGLKIQPNALEEMIKASQNDMRQVINQLSVWKLSKHAHVTYDHVKVGRVLLFLRVSCTLAEF